MSKQGRVVVLGASVSGLLAGRVLADFFDEVVLLDRESLDEGAIPRKAVPQGNHIHTILTPTFRTLQRFLPEVIEDLLLGGAHVFDAGKDVRFLFLDKCWAAGQTGQPMIGSTRPFFEYHLRRRVTQISNIDIRPGHRFRGWVTGDDGTRITGVIVENQTGVEELSADIVVDARGRASTLPKELEELGFEAPDEDRVGVELGYTSRLYRALGFSPDWNLLLLNAYAGAFSAGGVIEKVEDDQWIVTLFGYLGDYAPANDDGFIDFARALSMPDIAEFLLRAEPVSSFQTFGTRQCNMLRFERLDVFPGGLLAVGDAVCNLNPVYGQGITKAANEAVHLWESLSQYLTETGSLDGFGDNFRRSLPDVGAQWAWKLTADADLDHSRTTGHRELGDAFMGWYRKRLLHRATGSVDLRRRILDATMLIEPPESLLKPRMLLHAMGF